MSIFDLLTNHDRFALFLDYDGTMVTLKSWEPHTSPPDKEILHLVREIIKIPEIQFTITTGRNLQDIKNYFPMKGVFLASCHGGIIRDRSNKIYHLVPASYVNASVSGASKVIHSIIRGQRGFVLEDKKIGLALHYRKAYPQVVEKIKERFSEYYNNTLSKGEFDLFDWRYSIELRHKEVSKGKSVDYMIHNFTPNYYYPIFIGDDITDRDVNDYISDKGSFYYIGENIASVDTVREFLKALIEKYKSGKVVASIDEQIANLKVPEFVKRIIREKAIEQKQMQDDSNR